MDARDTFQLRKQSILHQIFIQTPVVRWTIKRKYLQTNQKPIAKLSVVIYCSTYALEKHIYAFVVSYLLCEFVWKFDDNDRLRQKDRDRQREGEKDSE